MTEQTERFTLELDRCYDATPEQVFAAWTDVDTLSTWWGCGPDMLWNVHVWDVRVGGAVHVSLDFEGTPFEVRGEFLDVDPPTGLRFSFGDDGEVVEMRIEPEGEGSRLYLTHSELPSDAQKQMVDGGWSHALGLLDKRLASGQPKDSGATTSG